MNENQLKITPEFVLELIIRRRWLILIPFCLVLIWGIYFSIVTTRIYEAKTLILVEGQRVPQNYVQSIVTEETGARINTISQQILSRTNLEQIVKEYSLFSGSESTGLYMEDKVAQLRKNISIDVISDRRRQTEAFEISYRGKEPEKVMRVANGLAGSFIDENLKVRESQAIGTSTFLDAELDNMRLRLEQVEENIKTYRKANMGELPEQLETNLRILERLQDDMSDRKKNLRESKILLAELKKQINAPQPSVVVIGGDQRQQDGSATLEELDSELEALQSRYTSKHPDIIRLKKQIAEMEARQKAATGTVDDTVSDIRIPRELRVQILEQEREQKITENDIDNLEAQIAVYEKRIENTPKKEQELLSLRRDYDNIKASYESLLNRKLEADIAVNMERKQKGEQFRIVDRARLPKRPVEPDLKKVFLIVVAAGIGLGGGLAVLLEYLNTSFRKPDDIENAYDLPVLATVPRIYQARQKLFHKIDLVGSVVTSFFAAGLLGIFAMICLKGGESITTALAKIV
jgi:polysaccharide chain length determinant protein (PEP-CTERM system associated)